MADLILRNWFESDRQIHRIGWIKKEKSRTGGESSRTRKWEFHFKVGNMSNEGFF